MLNTQTDVSWNGPWYERLRFRKVDRADWTDDMHVIAEEQAADGLDWSTRAHLRLMVRRNV